MVKRNCEGQIQTVEAITAAIILLSVVALVVEATSVTPLTSSFTNQHVKLELQNIGTDLLTALDETPESSGYPMGTGEYNSQLKGSIVKWLRDTGGYDWYACTNTKQYKSLLKDSNPPIDTQLTNALSLILLEKSGIAYNVDVRYPITLAGTGGETMRNTKLIWNGDPSSNSVTVSRIIVLHDKDLDGITYCVIPDVSNNPDTELYNVVEVRLTMWVM